MDVGAGYKLYPGMEPGKSFSGTRCENSEGVCVGDGKENRESSKGKAEKMIYIGLVDDECEHLMKMRTFLLQYEEEHNTKFSIQEFHNGLNFVEDYKGDLDIVFLNKLEKAIRFAKLKDRKRTGTSNRRPIFGGTGSGTVDTATAVGILQGLNNAGFETNEELSDMYVKYRADRPIISINDGQDWTLPEVPAADYSDEIMENAKEFSDKAAL